MGPSNAKHRSQHAEIAGADVVDAAVIASDDKDVGFLLLSGWGPRERYQYGNQ
jgi:hypothetical protein